MTLTEHHAAKRALLKCIRASKVTDFELIAEYGRISTEIYLIENLKKVA